MLRDIGSAATARESQASYSRCHQESRRASWAYCKRSSVHPDHGV